jgi:quercetin dioxygenase-like cupin family protein
VGAGITLSSLGRVGPFIGGFPDNGNEAMTTYHEPDSRVWSPVAVRGTAMEKSPVFEGNGMRSALFRMAPGCQIPDHHHSSWVQVAVISGRMRVQQDASPARIIPAGGVYFVSPGEDHAETAEVETVVLVTQGEDLNPPQPVAQA